MEPVLLRVSLSKIEIFGPRYFLDLPSQHVSERVVFGPFAVTRGRKLLETFSDLHIFSVPLHDEEVSWAGPWPGLWMPANRVLDTNMSG